MTLHAVPGAIIGGNVSAEGILVSADPPLVALQEAAGGAIGGPLLVPQLAALARLALRLKVLLSRPVLVAGEDRDIDLWVRALPTDGGVALSICDWKERGARGPSGEGFFWGDPVQGASAWTFQVDTQMRFVTAEAMPESVGVDLPAPGVRIAAHLHLLAGDDGDMPILTAMAERQAFRGQRAETLGDDPVGYTLSGVPVFDVAGRLLGYRGAALSDVAADADVVSVASVEEQASVFGRRLDVALRRPLTRIIANADTISERLEGPLRDDYAAYAADIASAGRHLMELVDDLADLQAIDRPDFMVAREDVDLADVARRTAGLLGMKAADRDIRIDPPDADEAMPAMGEFRRVLQIMVNLVGNALRYSPPGSMVWIRIEQMGDRATVTIADQGRGIAPEDQARIFEKFERLGRDDHGGSGLGLYISRKLARAMGGDIVVESALGQGARFTLSLPAA